MTTERQPLVNQHSYTVVFASHDGFIHGHPRVWIKVEQAGIVPDKSGSRPGRNMVIRNAETGATLPIFGVNAWAWPGYGGIQGCYVWPVDTQEEWTDAKSKEVIDFLPPGTKIEIGALPDGTIVRVDEPCVMVEYVVPKDLKENVIYTCHVSFTNKLQIPITNCRAFCDVDENSPYHSEVMTCGGSGDLDQVELDFGHIVANGNKTMSFKFSFPLINPDMPHQKFDGIFQLAPFFEVDYKKWGGAKQDVTVN
mmetsp:Transcript_26831/g.29916  ORF Transcript_26831/g.29916 Transcript_26831/m.29916 type:complete len:252 (-) Transcript_26831:53-808(-)